MKKSILSISILVLTILLSSCTKKSEYDINYTCSQDYKGQTLYVINWGEYMDDGLRKEFEKRCNVKVNVKVDLSNELMKSDIENSLTHDILTQYDLVIPSDYMVEYLIKNNELLPLDLSHIPNKVNIDTKFLGKSYDPQNQYSLPYFWGTIGLMYNKDRLHELGLTESDIDSWSKIFHLNADSKLKNQIYMYDTLRDLYTVALEALSTTDNPADINTTDTQKIEAATQLLKDQYQYVAGYGTDDIKQSIASGNVAVGMVFNGDYLSVLLDEKNSGDSGDDIGFIVPKEGTNLWFDNMVIPKTSQHKRLAEEFINFLLDSKVSYYNAIYVGYSTPNKEARNLMLQNDDYKDIVNLSAYNPLQEVIDKSQQYKDLSDVTVTINDKEVDFYQYLQDEYYKIKN